VASLPGRGDIIPVENKFINLGFMRNLFAAAKENDHELLVGFANKSTSA
jgi:hypothetical protein